MQFIHSAFFEGHVAVWLAALEILVFVSVAVTHMSFQFPRVEETLGAARQLTPEQLRPSVLQHVAAQVGFPCETTPAASNGALTRTRSGVHSFVLLQPPLSGESCSTVRLSAVEELQRRTADTFPPAHTFHLPSM